MRFFLIFFNVGVNEMTPEQENELNTQIAEWEKVLPDDGKYYYIQLELGAAYIKLKEFNKAIIAYEKVINPQLPSPLELDEGYKYHAQEKLAHIYIQLGQYDMVFKILNNIEQVKDINHKNRCYNLLGLAFLFNGDYKKAIEYYKKIEKVEFDNIDYYSSRLNLGILYERIGSMEDAAINWLEVTENKLFSFATAQLKLGLNYENENNLSKAIQCWNNIDNKHQKHYTYAQFYLGCIYAKNGNQKKSTECFNKFRDIVNKEHWGFIVECIDKNTLNDINVFYILYLSILLLETLQLEMIHHSERKLAHYTSTYVVNELLDKNSPIRLSHIGNMNDPTEGDILFKYLHDDLNSNQEYRNIDTGAFISCFTLNHDHLNQFRLYGKTAQKDATGVSLVVDKNFFKQPNFLELNSPVLYESDNIEINNKQEENFQEKKHLRPVYRCIYIDPETGYVRVSQRNKMTFYREFFQDKKSEDEIEMLWDNYQKYIQTKEHKVKNILKKMKKCIQTIISETNHENKVEVLELIQFILLPLQYLVKHSAFKEEEECRICYITPLNSNRVNMDFNNKSFYIDYPEPVKPHITNVYIATGAKEYYPFIVRLLGENSASKVQLSKNPFRVNA